MIALLPPLVVLAAVGPRPVRLPIIGALVAVGLYISPRATAQALVPVVLVALLVFLLPAGWTKESRRSIQMSVAWAICGIIALYPMSRVRSWLGAQDLTSLDTLTDWGDVGWGTLLIGLLVTLVGDAISYGMHRLKHRVPLFWRFHEIHHSAPELGLFAQRRLHPVDTFIGQVAQLLPVTFIGPNYLKLFLPYAILRTAAGYYHHSNTRLESRAVGWVFVTPSIHRTHHSRRFEDYDANFGSLFSFWDRLFGTFQEPSAESVANMGLDDPSVRVESEADLSLGHVFVSQLVDPFRPRA